ncbi:MAG TPA: demethoxyubiquinone hydroxylase family protein [Novosphingobium sp.]|nr:demethoxyubiquinone hydroxylase family protein [Novosphingobium sp.]HZV10401.1 demethoxyubiquinone hydroxylase family protein [Novosphingobium sp.]
MANPLSRKLDRILRVDQAGEYGAVRIYAGQMAVMGSRGPHAGKIAHMQEQEVDHREQFDRLLAARGGRPTALQPIWHVAGFALGAATALISPEAAMACTAAIETEIDAHYTRQLEELEPGEDDELEALITRARDEEREHRDTALASGAEQAPAYPLLSGAIRLGCKVAIALSERI